MLRYDESITALPGALRVYAPDGHRLATGAAYHPHSDGKRLAVRLRAAAGRGTYVVAWRVISADSHPVSGVFHFSVGHASKAPVEAGLGNDPLLSWLLGVTRWLGYLGCALLLGGYVFVAWCWPQGRTSRRARGVVAGGAAATVGSGLVGLLLKGPYDAGLGPSGVLHTGLLGEVLSTTYGKAMLARVLVGMALAVVALGARSGRGGPGRPAVFGVLGVGLLATYASAGHAVVGDQRALTVASDMLHTGGMALWSGGLAMLVLAARGDDRPDLMRFSRVATACVVVLMGTGTFQAWRQVGAWGALIDTAYGHALLVKLVLVAAVLAVAWFTRTRVHTTVVAEASQAVPGHPIPEEITVAAVRGTVLAEAVGILAVLAVTSGLVATAPARTTYHPSVGAVLQLGPDTVVVRADPAGIRSMAVDLRVFDAKGIRVDPPEVMAEANLPVRRLGPITVPLTKSGAGEWHGVLSVPVTGTWRLSVTVRTTAIDEYTRTVDVPVR